ncbi:hypothetical protein LZ32DRAFT_570907, partial [Colletotrichum eremochloae]
MAEPVGITGTAAGLVSLGLQLYGEISKYLSAVKGRQKDLDRARRHHQTLQMCMDAIAAATPSSRRNNTQIDVALKACILSCESELRALEALVARLQGPSTPTSGVLSAKLREKGRQYAFPFHRDSILELERALESTNGVLQTALQTLDLDVSSSIQHAVSSTVSDLELIRITQEDTHANVSNIEQSVNDVFTSVSQIEQIVPSINAQVIASTSAMMVQQSESWSQTTGISTRTEENTRNILQEVSLVRRQQNRIEEILNAMARGSANPRALDVETARLFAKPADLKTMCDAILRPQAQTEHIATSSSSSMNGRLCPCVRRRSVQRKESSWGPMFYTKLRKLTKHHLPGCPWTNITPMECEQNRAFGFRLYDIGSLLEGAVRFTWSLSFGAGGLSINRGIDWIPPVGEDRSPVFKISKILYRCLEKDTLDFREKEKVVQECFRDILWCYSKKLAYPSDVDENGATLPTRLMFHAISFAFWDKTQEMELAARIASRLLRLNIPFVGGTLTLWSICRLLLLVGTQWQMSDILRSFVQTWASATEFIDFSEFFYNGVGFRMESITAMQNSIDVAGLLECGSLALSILQEDEMEVSRILKSYPYTSKEVNSLGQTPCHIAVAIGNLRILELVLHTSREDVLNIPDNSGYYPVDYALATDIHQGCYNSQDTSACTGCKVLEIVLNSNCALYPPTLRYALGEERLAKSTRKLIIRHLKLRRKAFEALALTILSTNEASSLGIRPSRVLDKNAECVQRHLDARSFHVPNNLRVYPKDIEEWEPDLNNSVYALIYEKNVAAFAWSQGFKDVKIQPDDTNHYMKTHWECFDTVKQTTKALREIALYMRWLSDRQSDSSTIVWGHDFMEFLGANIGKCGEGGFTLPGRLSNNLFSESVTDCCSCYCSPGGCTPVGTFLYRAIYDVLEQITDIPWREMDPTTLDPSWHSEAGRRIFRSVRRLIGRKRHRSEQYAWLHQAILRQLT